MNMIDLHCDTLCKLAREYQTASLRQNQFHVDIEKMQKGNSLAQFFAIFIHGEKLEEYGGAKTAYEAFHACYQIYQRELAANEDILAPAYSYEDIMENHKAGKLSSVLTIEEGEAIGGDMAKLEEFYRLGVRLITLTWNYENCLGFPNSPDPAMMNKGLKPFGIMAVERMNDLGIAVDVSHLSDGGFWDVANHSKKPFLASHSNARAIKNHTRNLTDEMLRTLAEKGGITGINFFHLFLDDDKDTSRIEAMITHMKHIKKVAGIDVLALGSDFDGIGSTLEIPNIGEVPMLIPHLEKAGFSSSEIEKLFYGNALRFIKDVMKSQ